jgi:hypothetical protein
MSIMCRRGLSGSVVPRLRIGRRENRDSVPGGVRDLFVCTTASVHPASEADPRLYPMGTSSQGVKLAAHLHLMPKIKNAWSDPSIPPYIFMAWCLIKHRHNFIFLVARLDAQWHGETLRLMYVRWNLRNMKSATKNLVRKPQTKRFFRKCWPNPV